MVVGLITESMTIYGMKLHSSNIATEFSAMN